MISLRLAIDPLPIDEALVVRLCLASRSDQISALGRDAVLVSYENGMAEYDASGMSLRIKSSDPHVHDGDVLFIPRRSRTAHRMIRANSTHNTILVTEQCDQKCIMCSQPPKEHHVDHFESFSQAIELAPFGVTIGVTGGEPLLHKRQLFGLLSRARRDRPDLSFHVLTNGQHFDEDDVSALRQIGSENVLWGIPLYAANPHIHDRIVAKSGAFDRLGSNLGLLARVGAQIELRTVVLQSNVPGLEDLAQYISRRLSFINVWAIMQLERIGYGRMNWDAEFVDTSLDFASLSGAIDLATGRGIRSKLYNFPACTVPEPYRRFSVASISDWKNKFQAECDGCSLRSDCSGFFEWAPAGGGFANLVAQ